MTTPGAGAESAAKAQEVAAKLKPGTYDAVQALALLSIAQSLVEIAENLGRPHDVTS
jgi:hypothetical protein